MSLEERRKEKLMRNKAKLAEFGFSSKPAPALPKCENGNKEVSKPCNHQKSAGSMRVRKSEEEMHKEALIKSLKLPFGFKGEIYRLDTQKWDKIIEVFLFFVFDCLFMLLILSLFLFFMWSIHCLIEYEAQAKKADEHEVNKNMRLKNYFLIHF